VDEHTNQIEREIVAERRQLSRNLTELEMKAQQLADWRTYYRRNPKLHLGIALGGGLVLGAVVGRRQSPRDDHAGPAGGPVPSSTGRAGRQIEDTWQRISDALLGIASAKVIEFVSQVVPGFQAQLNHRDINGSDVRSNAGLGRNAASHENATGPGQ
jgi:hypothetical protein